MKYSKIITKRDANKHVLDYFMIQLLVIYYSKYNREKKFNIFLHFVSQTKCVKYNNKNRIIAIRIYLRLLKLFLIFP